MEEPDMACCRFDGNMPEYDPKGDLFTVKVHHGGALCYSPNVSYLRGDVMYFDNQHVEKLRMVDLREMTRMLGYTRQIQYFYQVPDRDLNYGLIELKQDEDILGMVKWVYDTSRIIDVYVVERPEMVLTVYKPQRVVREESLRNESNVEVPVIEQNMWEDFQPFEEEYQISEPFEEVYQISEQDYDSGSESSELEEFKDSDYDFSEDDRLFDVNVDRNVEWVGLMKGKRKEMTREHEHNTAGDEMNSDELISLDGSSSSDEDSRPKKNTRFYEFNSKADMVDPQFKDTYMASYEPIIYPINGSEMWPRTGQPPIIPPKCRRQPGRPKKARRKQPEESEDANATKLKRGNTTTTCSTCGTLGHNKRGCKGGPVAEKGTRQTNLPTHTPSFAPPILSHGGITINEPSVAPSAVTTTGTIPITAKGKEKIGGVRGGKRGGGRARGRARGIIINEPSAGPSAVTAKLGAGSSGKGNEKTGGGRGRGRDGCKGGGRGRGRAKGRGGKAMISNRPLLPMWDYSNFNIPSQESVHGPNVGK
ncbi:hypothetical protein RHMOL_Rhmol02G0233400 [Rhododendron molle]|uniref:Uncharacterized protein n=1 Tax=Rhododendron molle TaxID=49168 RepID=A0ACC0PV37_RHOML|nr:hypothetical protein RHMOL_Rhmol02G0233400 [Rhododendron molle]